MIVMQALNTSNEQSFQLQLTRNLPMMDGKKTSEFLETSLIYLLSAAVAVGAFVLVWLISLLLGLGQA